MVRHAGATVTRCIRGRDWETAYEAYERLKGKQFKKAVAEFGECVWYLMPKTKGNDKLSLRWGDGIWLGIREESGEAIIGTRSGVIKTNTLRRKGAEEER